MEPLVSTAWLAERLGEPGLRLVDVRWYLDPARKGRDAYRAGLLHGIANDLDWPTTGRLASLLGSLKIAQRGAQNHQFTRAEIETRFRDAFGRAM